MKKALSAAVLAAIIAGPVSADVMVVRSAVTESMGGFSGGQKDFTTWISADKHREESKGEGKPSMMERMSGVGQPEIVRLDKKLRWRLNVPKKIYTETPLVLPQEKTNEKAAEPENDRTEGASEKPTVKITKADVKVTPLNKKEKIGEFTCDGYEVRMELAMEDLESHEKTEMRMVTTLWNTAESGPVAQLKKEETAYAQAYARALGMTDAVQTDLKMLGATLLSGLANTGEKELSGALAKMPAEMKKIKGYPIRTHVEWYASSEGGKEEAVNGDAAEDNAEIPTNVSDALGSFAAGFAKKKMEAKQPAKTADGRLMLAMTTEVKSISPAFIPDATFEIPAGFKKGH